MRRKEEKEEGILTQEYQHSRSYMLPINYVTKPSISQASQGKTQGRVVYQARKVGPGGELRNGNLLLRTNFGDSSAAKLCSVTCLDVRREKHIESLCNTA